MNKSHIGLTSIVFAAALCAVAQSASADAAAAAAAGVDLDVEYCESTGEQYIDTGILGNPGLRVEAEIMWTDANPTDDQHILGSFDRINNGNTPWRCYPISMYKSRMAAFYFGSDGYPDWFQYTIGKKYRVTTEFGASQQSLTVDRLDGTSAFSQTVHINYSAVESGKTLYLFALGHGTKDGGVACMTKARVYWLKIYQNGTLVRDYRPACQGDVYGLWEDVNGTFCGSATSTPFKTTVSPRTVAGEPDYFAQWIQSNGSTYIDTGIIGRPETKIEASFQWKTIADRRLICVSTSGRYFHVASGSNGEMWFRSGSSTLTMNGVAYAADTDYTIVSDVHASSQTYSVTGPFGTVATNDSQTAVNAVPNTFFIFAENLNGETYGAASTVRLYSMKIWQDGALVRDFVPGIRDGEGCLYDRVSGKCFLSFNGAITSAAGLVGPPAGTPTQPKYKLSYLGSEGNSYIDTGVLGNPGFSAVAEVAWMAIEASDDMHVLGSFDNSSYGSGVSRRCYAVSAWPPTGLAALGVGASNFRPAFTYTVGQKYRIESNFGETEQTLAINDSFNYTANGTFSEVNSGQTLYLFALGHSSKGVACKTKSRVYSLKIYQNGTLVRDYVPVIADNGGPYLYDRATGTFCQGATSGLWDVGEVGDEFSPAFTIIIR